ncbi:T9SS type A sorting domain-containing protein [Seonamhaeicola sediminis]|nr:T9SS type A sorting domain-containing protein [Seonamhaeicola sediminis]
MYNFTKKQNKDGLTYVSLVLKKCFKHISSLGVVLVFMVAASGNLQAQVVPCVDGQSSEWGTVQMWAEPNHDYQMDSFDVPNGDDIFTSSKDFKLYNGDGQEYNNWTISSMQPKSDIMNAAAVILTGIVPDAGAGDCLGYTDNKGTPDDNTDDEFVPYDPEATYLFFAGDRETTNGDGQIGFWFLINGSGPTTDGDGNKIFSPAHYTNFGTPKPGAGRDYDLTDIDDGLAGDLLVLANFEGGGRDAVVTVLMWVGAGNGTQGNNNSLIVINSTAQVAENNAGTAAVPGLWTVPDDLMEYAANQFYEGVIDLSQVFDLSTQDICSTTWMLETRATKEITADAKDFAAGTFNLAPQIRAEGDEVCEGDSGTLEAELYIFTDDGVDDNDTIIPNAGYTFHWFAAADWNGGDPNLGDAIGDGTYQLTVNTAGTYYVIATSVTKCDALGFGTAILTVNDNPDPTANNLAECESGADNGSASFDLTSALTAADGGTVSYHTSQADANNGANAIGDPANYVSSGETIYIRSYNAQTMCYGTTSFTLTVNDNPDPTANNLTLCEIGYTGSNTFDLTSALTAADGGTVSYHTSQADANNGANAIGDPANYVSSGETIYIRSYNAQTMCYGTTSFTLTVNDNPDPTANNLAECESGADNGSASFDLTSALTAADGGTVSYHTSQADANNGANAIGDPANYVSSGETIYIRSYNAQTMCYGTISFTLTVNPNPACNASNSSEGLEFGLCEGTTLSLSVLPADTNLYTYSWTSNMGATINNANMPNATADDVADGEVFTVVITNKQTECYSSCTTTARYYDCTPDCETAFAVRTEDVEGFDSVVEDSGQATYSSCFRNDGFKRWGWTNTITSHGTYTYSVYQGAGRCDLSKGTYVGDLIVEYKDDDTVSFEYDLLTWDHDNDGGTPEVPLYLISEVHLYVGCNPYPTKKNGDLNDPEDYTVAPGQYSFNANIPEGDYYPGYTADLSGVTGAFYFIAHTVICSRDVPDEANMHIPGESRDYGEIDPLTPNQPIQGDCYVPTDGWGKIDGDKEVAFTAYPVPFKDEVNVSYRFEYDTNVNIDVYDMKGALIRHAENTNYIKGTVDKTSIDLSRADDQMYFVRVTTSKGTLIKKIISANNLSRE